MIPATEVLDRNTYNNRSHGGGGGHPQPYTPPVHAPAIEVLNRNTYNNRSHGGGEHPQTTPQVDAVVREQLKRNTHEQRGYSNPSDQSLWGFGAPSSIPAPQPVWQPPVRSGAGVVIIRNAAPTDRRVSTLFFAIILGFTIAAAINFSPLGIGVALFVGGVVITRANKRHDHDQIMQ